MDALMVKLHLEENGLQMVFEGVEAIEDTVMEGLLTQVIPEVLNRIEFGSVRWQFEQAQIGGQRKGFTLMPAGAIEHHDDPLMRMSRGHLVEE
jgi:hypothetical protein